MSYFLQNGDIFSPTPGKEAVLEKLPVRNYVVIETMQGLALKQIDPFSDPGRLYGDVDARADRILDTFMDRPRATGVLLSGEKGSGKSLLARNVSYRAYDRGIPTILVNAPFAGDAFNTLLASVEQPAIVLMDEFEKVYQAEQGRQEQVLTLLDGVVTTKKLFLMTVNDRYRVNEHMYNRPGRIYYLIEFDGLENSFVREYCQDNLHDKDEIDNVLKIGAMFRAFNFDMLKALVEEMNRYKESAFDVIEILNTKPMSASSSARDTYEVIATSPDGIKSVATEASRLPMEIAGNILGISLGFEKPVAGGSTDPLMISLFGDTDDEDEAENDLHYLNFIIRSNQMKRIDVDRGRYEFVVDGFTILFTKKVPERYNMRSLSMWDD